MTVATKVGKALAHLKQAQASFESFALETKDKTAQKMYKEAADATDVLVQSLEGRLDQIRDQEPEFRS